VRCKFPRSAMSKSVRPNQSARAAAVLRWGCVRLPGSCVRHGDLPLASPADEPDHGRSEGSAKRGPVSTARQGRILAGAERRLNLTLHFRYIHTHHTPLTANRRRCQRPSRKFSPTGLSAAMHVTFVPQASARRQINATL
jgi:hypothetical protein